MFYLYKNKKRKIKKIKVNVINYIYKKLLQKMNIVKNKIKRQKYFYIDCKIKA